ncbi:MAG: hypothetical protein CME59_08920 [Halioglobus sp.]|nr:hypothetical protein [Halioglobus sp.]
MRKIALVLLALCALAACGPADSGAPDQRAALDPALLQTLPAARAGQVLIYGAYGFTGAGISRLAADYGIAPVLAGRNPEKLQALADELGYAYIPLTLDRHDDLVRVLSHFELVMHVAGPYTYTAEPMLDAALEAGTHYVDITGEMHVIQAQLARHAQFAAANIMLMPAVGFDVVPTDCLNLYVAQQVRAPDHLSLVMNTAYQAAEGAVISRGTAKSGLEMLSRPLLLREDGVLVPATEPRVQQREINGQMQTLVQVPWADLVTSWVSTGIPTIEVYQLQQGEMPAWLLRLMRTDWGKALLGWVIDTFFPEGPPPQAQQTRQVQLIATASNAAGDSASAQMITPEPYLLTFHSSLIIARRILDGHWEPGFRTPAQVYGAHLALEIPGVSRQDL